MTKYLLTAGLLLAFARPSDAQSTGYVSGTVTDDSTGEATAYASVLAEGSFLGTAAGEDGRYLLELPTGEHTIRFQAVGYEAAERQVAVTAGDTTRLAVRLAPEHLQLGTITIEAEALSERPSVYRLTPESIESAPSLGEPDVIRAAASLPGLTQANDTKASLNVWGGTADQNKYLLDGIAVYSPGHLGGVFSAFNPKALESADINAGNFPARYGGRLSSVFALQTKSRPDTSLARAHISLLSASVGTAKRFGNTFVAAAARRTYLDPVMIIARLEYRYNFHDANLKIIQDLGEGFSLAAIGFRNRDYWVDGVARHRAEPTSRFQWGNHMGALRLRKDGRRFDHRLTGSAAEKFTTAEHRDSGFVQNRLLDLTAAYDGQWLTSRTHLRFGGAYRQFRLQHRWNSENLNLEKHFSANLPVRFARTTTNPLVNGYLSGEHLLTERLSLNGGLRYSSLGGVTRGCLSPRLSASYRLNSAATLTAGAGRYVQHIGPARSRLGASPEEFALDNSEPLFLLERPQVAWTYSLGSQITPSPAYRIRATAYYRRFSRLAWLQTGEPASFPSFQYGEGRAYGANVFLEKRRGWLTFQLGYAMTYPSVDRGAGWHTAAWSIPHALKGMLGFELGPWQLSLAGRYRSGLPFTPAVGRFLSVREGWMPSPQRQRPFPESGDGSLDTFFIPGEPNSGRFPPYWRMDMMLRRRYENRLFIWDLYVQAINLLYAKNGLQISPRRLYSDFEASAEASLPIIPSLGAELTFK